MSELTQEQFEARIGMLVEVLEADGVVDPIANLGPVLALQVMPDYCTEEWNAVYDRGDIERLRELHRESMERTIRRLESDEILPVIFDAKTGRRSEYQRKGKGVRVVRDAFDA